MHQPSAPRRLATALRSAAIRHAAGLRDAEASTLAGHEARFLLARFGLALRPAGEEVGAWPSSLSESDRAAALPRLRTESRRLARLARARHPAYDLNRHIAVRRLLAALDPASRPSRPGR